MIIPTSNQKGFSLVEIAVVIGIIGLILGGIMAGRHVITAAELNATVKEAGQFQSAQAMFKEKYGYLPGDLPDATRYFGRDIHMSSGADNTTCLNGYTGANATITSGGTCNGDGDGDSGTNPLERFSWAQQLSEAKLIDGTYGGYYRYNLALLGITSPLVPEPLSRRSGAYWRPQYTNTIWRLAYGWANLPLGSYGVNLYGDAFTPEEAWSLDKKFDDGFPTTGMMVTTNGNTAPVFPGKPYCTLTAGGATGTVYTDTTATYNLKYANRACDMNFLQKR